MSKLFFIKTFFVPAAFFSLIINLLLLSPTYFMLQLYDRVINTRSEEALWLLIVLLFIALVVMGALEVVRSHILVTANNAIDAQLAPLVLNKTIEEATSPEGDQYRYAMKDLTTVRTFLTGYGMVQALDVPWLPIYMVLLYVMNPYLFYLLTLGSIIMVLLTMLSNSLTKQKLSEASGANREASRFMNSGVTNAEAVNAMGMKASLIRRWSGLNDRTIVLQTRASSRAGAVNGTTKFLRQFIQSMAMATGTYICLKDPSFTPGAMIAGGILFGKALGPMEYLISGWGSLLETKAAYTRLDAFFKRVTEGEPHLMELPPPTGQISVEHVTFGIRATSKVLVRDVTFSLAAGEFLGIVGASASGKSTLARLLVNVWKPLQGVIRLDGSDAGSWPAERLGRHIGYLPQDIELFAGTVAENIARLEEPDSDKVIAAAKLAGLHEIILHMANGYDTQVGEGGAILSGGQRQRIGFARALYGNPKILVLDEPNSSLDSAGEQALVNALLQLKAAGKTTILITHNPSFLAHVDKLLVMQEGMAIAFGSKDAVLNQAHQTQVQGEQRAQVTA
ncbi:type I secretion system permease/ATPase [Geomesophilobacter sediminis]|uniref:Type I secretion system permease/ATPase n=1 Tax=Geomesophilobacter sediminis TaxID=2798584 RepID=A0A8J7M2B3_9BACT|nr:type I secretion system permease/ATPase [Geomesophilobacter sediminis]MBJ6727429.1 type I secretion system permease/ATPase [Geomesophilobacter sediminis]